MRLNPQLGAITKDKKTLRVRSFNIVYVFGKSDLFSQRVGWSSAQSAYIQYTEYHNVCPLLGIGTIPSSNPSLAMQRVCPSPQNRWGGEHTRRRVRGWGSPNSDDWRKNLSLYTVTRPYEGFRHLDRMAPDQTVRGRENECSIWSGKLLPQVPKFSLIINRSFPKPPEISGDFSCEKLECAWWDRTHFLRISFPLLYPYTKATLY